MAKYGLNQVTLIGNLGRDPELKYTDKGIAVTTLPIACTESYRDQQGNNIDRTTWVNVVFWRGQAEIAGKYCRKGSTICVEGRISTRSYTTAENETRYITEVEGRRLILLDPPPSASGGGTFAKPLAQPVGQTPQVTTPQQPVSQSQPQTPAAKPDVEAKPPQTTTAAEDDKDPDDLPF
jgi:single-strand DNA-binding protein